MVKSKNVENNSLVERVVRNEDIFCSLLFDRNNRTLRVVDFRGGNFQSKHAYLEQVLLGEGMRKIYTLIERDDMNGWQRVGYHREGSIPGYYKRSDAYIMSRIYDADFDAKSLPGEEVLENKEFLTEAKSIAKDFSEYKEPSFRVEPVTEPEAGEAIRGELNRLAQKAKDAKGKKAKGKKTPAKAPAIDTSFEPLHPLFPQFSREVEYHYFTIRNRRTKQTNVVGAEYQDCFGNAKVQLFFSPETRTDQILARSGLLKAIDRLTDTGAVSIFATVRADDLNMNALYASAGFRNTGWMNRQMLSPEGPVDLVLWTKKLI